MSRLEIRVPPGAQIRMTVRRDATTVTIAPVGLPTDLAEAVVTGKPGLHQLLTHDEGVDWPDTVGCQLANLTLSRGDGLVVAEFVRLADALAFRRRLGDPPPAPVQTT